MFKPGDRVRFFGFPAVVEWDKYISVSAATATRMTGRKERVGYERRFIAPSGETFWLVRSCWNEKQAFHVIGAHFGHLTK